MIAVADNTTAGDAYDAVLLAGLREHVFDLEDYDAEAAARAAAAEVPQLGAFIRGPLNTAPTAQTTADNTAEGAR